MSAATLGFVPQQEAPGAGPRGPGAGRGRLASLLLGTELASHPDASLPLLGSAVGNLGMKLFTTRVLTRWGLRDMALLITALTARCIAACGWLTPGTPVPLTLA